MAIAYTMVVWRRAVKLFTQLHIKYLYLLYDPHTSKSVNRSPIRLDADGFGPLTPLFDGAGSNTIRHLSATSLFLSEITTALQ